MSDTLNDTDDATAPEPEAPQFDLLRPLALAGATANLQVTFPPATEAERKAAAERAASQRRLGGQIAASSQRAAATAAGADD